MRDYALTHVNVVDIETGTIRYDQTVVISGTRIQSVAQSTSKTPGHSIVARDKFLIPGLWDMHVHALYNATVFLPELLAWGVTGFRDTWGDLRQAREWREKVKQGALAPRFFVAGNLLDGSPVIWPGSSEVKTAERAIELVDSLNRAGSPFIKVYQRLSPEVYYAIANEAKRLGVPFVGHVPTFITAAQASDAGQKSLEHITAFWDGCTSREAEIIAGRRANLAATQRNDSTFPRAATTQRIMQLQRTSYDSVTCGTLMDRFARNKTWITPTLVLHWGAAHALDSAVINDSRIVFVPKKPREEWLASHPSKATVDHAAYYFGRGKEMIRLADRHNVQILAGTDFSNPWIYAGSSLHDELALLVESGLSNASALRAATLNPARFLATTDSLGTIAKGKLADLVILDADPLRDIRNTRRISAVVVNGKYLDRNALDALLAKAREAVDRPTQ
ncbi:MAG TPA: amidohydrolase family protein [Longimicrobiales bacterium]|nr:amidohydrolase family protein [Longimicrobiales bacterium]